jgi:hypothetical protein
VHTQRPRHQRPKLSDAEQQAVLGLLASGMSVRAVAKQFGVSYASIDRMQRRHRPLQTQQTQRTQQTPQAPQDCSAADAAGLVGFRLVSALGSVAVPALLVWLTPVVGWGMALFGGVLGLAWLLVHPIALGRRSPFSWKDCELGWLGKREMEDPRAV